MLADNVYEVLKRLIMDQQFPPGSALVMDQLAKRLRVSITPIREALARLESEDLVARVPLHGYTVKSELSVDEMADLYDFREIIEPAAADLAARRRSATEVAWLTDLHAKAVADGSGDPYETYRHLPDSDNAFHRAIMEISGNRNLRLAYLRTNAHLGLFRRAFDPSQVPATLEEHEAIVAAITAGDGDGAALAMLRHLRESRRRALVQVSTGPAASGGARSGTQRSP